MQVKGYKLKCDSLSAHIILEASLTFVVKNLELGVKAPIGDLGMEDRVGSDEICFTSLFYWLRNDYITVMVIEDHEVLAAATGGDWEAASLVSGYSASKFNCLNKHLMGSGWGAHVDLGGQEGQWRLKVWLSVCSAGLVSGVILQLLETWEGVCAPTQM